MARRTHSVRIPIGLEKFLCRIAGDPGVEQRLRENREAVLAPHLTDLDATERQVVESIPTEMLLALVKRIDVKAHARNRFMRGVLAASVLASTSLAIEACDEVQSKGVQPDWPGVDATEIVEVDDASRGIQPDMVGDDLVGPPDVITVEDTAGTKGILPDPPDGR